MKGHYTNPDPFSGTVSTIDPVDTVAPPACCVLCQQPGSEWPVCGGCREAVEVGRLVEQMPAGHSLVRSFTRPPRIEWATENEHMVLSEWHTSPLAALRAALAKAQTRAEGE